MTNKRDLKAFVRYDGSGRVVAGSLILRRQKPKVGKWKEIQGYQCCNAPVLNTDGTIPAFPVTDTNSVIYCDTVNASYVSWATIGTFATIEELVSAMNIQNSYVGTFSVAPDGVNVNVNPSLAIAQGFRLCLSPSGLFFEIAA